MDILKVSDDLRTVNMKGKEPSVVHTLMLFFVSVFPDSVLEINIYVWP
jgi:hypothetical protein